MSNTSKTLAALGLLAAALAWPTMAGALVAMTLTPYERALQASWCGGSFHQSFVLFGHCAACWAGSAVLMLLALIVAHEPARSAALAIARYSRRL